MRVLTIGKLNRKIHNDEERDKSHTFDKMASYEEARQKMKDLYPDCTFACIYTNEAINGHIDHPSNRRDSI
jgi:hypothetical protein